MLIAVHAKTQLTFLIIDQLSSTSGVKLCIEYQLLLKTLKPADLNCPVKRKDQITNNTNPVQCTVETVCTNKEGVEI